MPGTEYQDWYAYVLAAFCVIVVILERGRTPKSSKWLLLCVGTCVANLLSLVISVIFSPRGAQSADLFEVLRQTYPIAVFLAGASIWERLGGVGTRAFLYIGSIGVLLACALGLALQAVVPEVSWIMYTYFHNEATDAVGLSGMLARPGLTLGNPNILGLAIALWGTMAVVNGRGETYRNVMLGVGTLTLIAVTGSRTGMMAYVVGLIVLIAFRVPGSSTALVSALGGAASYLSFGGSAFDGERCEVRYFEDFSSLYIRYELWADILESPVFLANQVLGVGPDRRSIEVYDNGYVLRLYRQGMLGLIIQCVGSVLLIVGCVRWGMRGRWKVGPMVCAVLAINLFADLASAPLTDPKYCTFHYALLAVGVLSDFADVPISRRPVISRVIGAPEGDLS